MPNASIESAAAAPENGLEKRLEVDSNPLKILIYTHDTYGLGNIRRMLAIAEHLVATDPRVHVLLITGSPMVQAFRVAARIDFVKLPCLERDHRGIYQARSLPMEVESLVRMRAQLIRSALLSFSPDLVLVDKKPLGVKGELAPALTALDRLPRPPALVLILRDILDNPEKTMAAWERHGYHDVIDRWYQLVLVAGQPEVFDLADEYRFPMATRRKLRYCGYIRRRELPPPPPARVPSTARVLVSVGGGGDGAKVILHYLNGLARHPTRRLRLPSRIITGPELPTDERKRIEALTRRLPDVRLEAFCEEMSCALSEADLVVGMCGYNSICEVLASGRRAVVVPRVTPVEEQWIRAQRFARRGLLDALHPDRLTPERLMRAIEKALAVPPPDAAALLDFDGLNRIAYWVQRVLADRNATLDAAGSRAASGSSSLLKVVNG